MPANAVVPYGRRVYDRNLCGKIQSKTGKKIAKNLLCKKILKILKKYKKIVDI